MGGTGDSERLHSTGSLEVDDPLLARLDAEELAAEPVPLRSRRRWSPPDAGAAAPPPESDDPFDLEVPRPAAYDLRRLCQLSGQPLPADLRAALGARVPILLCHGMTPFYKGGQRPTGVWGMGYQAALVGVEGDTVGFLPRSELLEVAAVDQEVTVGLEAGGGFSLVPELAGAMGAALPVSLPGAKLHAATRQNLRIALSCRFGVVAVQAGPVGAGGVRWNLYRARDSIEAYQPLFHTLRLPEGVDRLQVEVRTWVRRSGRFFGLLGARHWEYPPRTFEVSLAGLGP